MTGKADAIRQAKRERSRRHRAQLRAQGLRPMEVWAYPKDHAFIKQFAANLARTPP